MLRSFSPNYSKWWTHFPLSNYRNKLDLTRLCHLKDN